MLKIIALSMLISLHALTAPSMHCIKPLTSSSALLPIENKQKSATDNAVILEKERREEADNIVDEDEQLRRLTAALLSV